MIRRRIGQSIAEFSVVIPVFMTAIIGFGIIGGFIFSGWATSRSLEWIGGELTTGGNPTTVIEGFDTAAGGFGADWDPETHPLTVTVSHFDPIAGETTETVSTTSSVGGWISTPAIRYGDAVRVQIAKPFSVSGLSEWVASTFGILTVEASWSGVAQRDSIDPGAIDGGGIATGRIIGVVTDRATGLPIAGASVTITATGQSALTAADGLYQIDGVAPSGGAGTDLVATAAGYAPAGASVPVAAAAVTTQNLIMDAAGTLFVWVQGSAGATPPLPANPGFEGTSSDMATRYNNTIAADSPVAHYRFGETGGTTAVDEIAGRNGTYVGDPLIGASGAIAGDADGAIAVGGNDGVTIGSAAAWTLPSITVEVWAKLTGSSATETVIARRGGTDDYEWALTRLASGALRASIRTASTTISVTSAGTYADGNYHLVALTHNGTTLRLNIDGVAAGSTSAGARPGTNLPIGFGIDADGAGNGLSGSLDEAAIYGAALPESTLTAHYRAGVSAIGSTADWSAGSGLAADFVIAPEGWSAQAAVRRTGGAAAEIVVAAADSGIHTDVVGPFAAGTAYTATAWIRGTAGRTLGLSFGIPGSADAARAEVAASGDWQEVNVSWTPASTRAAATIAITPNASSATLTTAYVDDVTIARSVGGITGATVTTATGQAATELGSGWYSLSLAPGSHSVIAVSGALTGSAGPVNLAAGTSATLAVTIAAPVPTPSPTPTPVPTPTPTLPPLIDPRLCGLVLRVPQAGAASTLTPAFDSFTLGYTAAAASYADGASAELVATACDTEAISVRLNSGATTAATSGVAVAIGALTIGSNTITVTATEDGSPRSYTLSVTRTAPSTNIAISGLTVTLERAPVWTYPSWSSSSTQTIAIASVPAAPAAGGSASGSLARRIAGYEAGHANLAVSVSDANATISAATVAGSSCSGAVYQAPTSSVGATRTWDDRLLLMGSNTICLSVTAEDGSSTATYAISAFHEAWAVIVGTTTGDLYGSHDGSDWYPVTFGAANSGAVNEIVTRGTASAPSLMVVGGSTSTTGYLAYGSDNVSSPAAGGLTLTHVIGSPAGRTAIPALRDANWCGGSADGGLTAGWAVVGDTSWVRWTSGSSESAAATYGNWKARQEKNGTSSVDWKGVGCSSTGSAIMITGANAYWALKWTTDTATASDLSFNAPGQPFYPSGATTASRNLPASYTGVTLHDTYYFAGGFGTPGSDRIYATGRTNPTDTAADVNSPISCGGGWVGMRGGSWGASNTLTSAGDPCETETTPASTTLLGDFRTVRTASSVSGAIDGGATGTGKEGLFAGGNGTDGICWIVRRPNDDSDYKYTDGGAGARTTSLRIASEWVRSTIGGAGTLIDADHSSATDSWWVVSASGKVYRGAVVGTGLSLSVTWTETTGSATTWSRGAGGAGVAGSDDLSGGRFSAPGAIGAY